MIIMIPCDDSKNRKLVYVCEKDNNNNVISFQHIVNTYIKQSIHTFFEHFTKGTCYFIKGERFS